MNKVTKAVYIVGAYKVGQNVFEFSRSTYNKYVSDE